MIYNNRNNLCLKLKSLSKSSYILSEMTKFFTSNLDDKKDEVQKTKSISN